MSMNLKQTLFKTVAVLAMIAPAAGSVVDSPVMASATNQNVSAKRDNQQNANGGSADYKKLCKDQTHLDEDQDKAGQTGTAGSTLAQQNLPKDKSKVARDKKVVPKNLQTKAEQKAQRIASGQESKYHTKQHQNFMKKQDAKKQAAKKQAAKKAAAKKRAEKKQAQQKKANKPKKQNNGNLVNKPTQPKHQAKQTPKQKAAQRDAKGEAANTTGQKQVPKGRTPKFSKPSNGNDVNTPKRHVVKKSLPQTLESKPMTYITLGAGAALIFVGGSMLRRRRNQE